MKRVSRFLCVVDLLLSLVVPQGCAPPAKDHARRMVPAPANLHAAFPARAAMMSLDARDIEAPGEPGKATYEGFGEVFDEVWVIRKPGKPLPPQAGDDTPGSGELRALLHGDKEVPLPLTRTAVTASVAGYLSSVLVTQQYHNPYAEKIEAVYVFPLPENSAVSDFVMKIGERRIRGVVRERVEAERIYRDARSQGYVASLLTQERPNVFTQKVANIEPGMMIDIEIGYFSTLSYEDGQYSFVFPMVVGPRYTPPGTTNGVAAVARGASGLAGQSTAIQYLKPGERSGNDIMVTVDLDAGVPIEEIRSATHAIDVRRTGATVARVSLKPADTLPNKDFVLRYRVAGTQVKSALMVERGEDGGGWFTLMLQPPGNLADVPRSGLEIVFLLDVSGSMAGFPLESARAAARRSLKSLRPEDTFQIAYFADGSGQLAPAPLPATAGNIQRGVDYLDGLRGAGGTEMLAGIRAALDFPHDPKRLRIVAFMTDGYVGNETQILAAVAEKLGPSRIFSFGVGSSVNRYLMEGLARLGHGAVAYLLSGDSGADAVDRFFERVQHPALTDIAVDWGTIHVSDVYPKRVPDLFIGRPVVLTGRFEGRGDAEIKVRGLCAGEPRTITLRAALDDPKAKHAGISRIWARARIADLSEGMSRPPGESPAADPAAEIQTTALAHGLVSAYTAFVAVDETRVTEGDHGVTVLQPVPVPEGVKYETTIPER